jgi:hypothetical protein
VSRRRASPRRGSANRLSAECVGESALRNDERSYLSAGRGKALARPADTYSGKQMGRVTHRVVAQIVAAGIVKPTPEQIIEVVADFVRLLPDVPYRRAAQQRLSSGAALYFHFYQPKAEWQLLGAEVQVPGAVVDLLWQRPDGGVFADELKTGRFGRIAERRDLDLQVARICAGGRRKYGGPFLGCREALLKAPALAAFVTVDGRRLPVSEEEGWK